jgi:two-component system chemotaxis sensor kinase CheA
MSLDDGIAIFRVEAQELLEQIEQGLLDLAHNPNDAELIGTVFRALHTLKGSGAMFGFAELAAFTHHCETTFDRVRKGEVRANRGLVTAVLGAMDHMRALAEERPVAAGEGDALLAALSEAADTASPDDGALVDAPAEAARTTWRMRFTPAPDVLVNGTRPLAMLDELRAMGDCEIRAITHDVPALDSLTPTDCYLGWDIVLTTAEPLAAIEDVFMFVRLDTALRIEAVSGPKAVESAMANETKTDTGAGPEVRTREEQCDVTPIDNTTGSDDHGRRDEDEFPAAAGRASVPPVPAVDADLKTVRPDASVRVPALRLDELMDRVGELVIAQSRLKQIAGNSNDMNLRSVAEEIEHLASELRDSMMAVRMVPVIQLFGRFRRLIHDLARETGKDIDLVTEGEATELDKTVIERLADPLVHLIRNAADHGLETPQERRAAGKPARGRITLSAAQAGAEVMITVSDDGRGVNRRQVRAKAEENGLIPPGAPLPDQDLLQLIFQPGFSTAAAVTNLSGRGVGMDVVKRTIESLRGSLELTSPPGQGSRVALRIPLTLAIIDGLLVRVGAARYVIPLSSVEECLELSTEQDRRSAGRSLLTIRKVLVPFVRLRELFRTGTPPALYQKIVVIATGTDRVGLVVDQILGNYQTVIKPLSAFHVDVASFSGATILGDGSVALILDVGALATAAAQHDQRPLRAAS